MNLLLLTKEPYPNNRSLINELWLNEIPTQGVNVTWISELQNHSLRHQKEFNSYTNIFFYLSPLIKKLFFGRSKFSFALNDDAKFIPNNSLERSSLANNLNSFPTVIDSPPSITPEELILSIE